MRTSKTETCMQVVALAACACPVGAVLHTVLFECVWRTFRAVRKLQFWRLLEPPEMRACVRPLECTSACVCVQHFWSM